MEIQFITNQYKITEANLSNSFDGLINNVEELNLWNISISPSGHGHYFIETTFYVNTQKLITKTRTSNMFLIDAWKSGMNDLFENGENGFDNWNRVVETMLSIINGEDEIIEFAENLSISNL